MKTMSSRYICVNVCLLKRGPTSTIDLRRHACKELPKFLNYNCAKLFIFSKTTSKCALNGLSSFAYQKLVQLVLNEVYFNKIFDYHIKRPCSRRRILQRVTAVKCLLSLHHMHLKNPTGPSTWCGAFFLVNCEIILMRSTHDWSYPWFMDDMRIIKRWAFWKFEL